MHIKYYGISKITFVSAVAAFVIDIAIENLICQTVPSIAVSPSTPYEVFFLFFLCYT